MKVNLPSLTALLLYRAVFAASATSERSTCVDSSTFVVDGLEGKTCDWVKADINRLTDYCEVEEVRSNCPRTCGSCCEDDHSFVMSTSEGMKDCEWISRLTDRRKSLYCDAVRKGIAVSDACPKACDACSSSVAKDEIVQVLERMEGNETGSWHKNPEKFRDVYKSLGRRVLKPRNNLFTGEKVGSDGKRFAFFECYFRVLSKLTY